MQTQITVRRPAGNIEIVFLDREIKVYERTGIETATKNGGRGEIIDWLLILSPEELAEQDTQERAIEAAEIAESMRQERVFNRMDARRYGARINY